VKNPEQLSQGLIFVAAVHAITTVKRVSFKTSVRAASSKHPSDVTELP